MPIFTTLLLAALAASSDPQDAARAAAARLQPTDFVRDVAALSAAPRDPGSAGHALARALCRRRLREAGFTVLEARYATGVNVVGMLPGSEQPQQQVLLSAHYDSVPHCAGADDNATGLAGVLAAGTALAAHGPLPRTLVVACWDEEEPGMIGSTAYAELARLRGDTVAQSFVLEMIGYRDTEPNTQAVPPGFRLLYPRAAWQLHQRQYRGDTLVLVGDQWDTLALLRRHAEYEALPVLALYVPPSLKNTRLFAPLRRSDHASFWHSGYPAVMLTDTAELRNRHYHCQEGDDSLQTLDFEYALTIVRITIAAVMEAAQSDSPVPLALR